MVRRSNYFNWKAQINSVQTPPSTVAFSSGNIPDDLPALQTPKAPEPRDELERYLSIERELHVKDGLLWWYERKYVYPRLYWMVVDYLSIPGMLFYFLFSADLSLKIY